MRDYPYSVICRECNRRYTLMVNLEDYKDWQWGEPRVNTELAKKTIQRVMPYLTADERELMISGVCGECYDKLWEVEQ